jgi:hypothetical protein
MVGRRLRTSYGNRSANAAASRRTPEIRSAEDRSVATHDPGTRASTRTATHTPGLASRRPPRRRRSMERSRPRLRTIGTPLEPRNVDRAWHAARKDLGLDTVRLHDLRHACATFLLASAASPRTVMKTLGPQPNFTDHEHLRARPARDRTGRRRGRRTTPGRMIKMRLAVRMAVRRQRRRPSFSRLCGLSWALDGAPPGTRTPNPRIKRVSRATRAVEYPLTGRQLAGAQTR